MNISHEAIVLCSTIDEWQAWLAINHDKNSEAWLLMKDEEHQILDYIETVEVGICYGWIDGISKRVSKLGLLQRFTPRSKKSHWTELNKERARRLIAMGLMHKAGLAVLPDLESPMMIREDVKDRLREAGILEIVNRLPALYQRVRISYIQEFKAGSPLYEKRLAHFIDMTFKQKLYGNWNDGGKLLDYEL